MNSNPEEKRLQALFADLKQQDERLVPPFQRVLAAGLRRKNGGIAGRIGFEGYVAAVAALVIVAVTIGILSHHRAVQPSIVRQLPLPDHSNAGSIVEPAAMSLSNWQSPTAFLLQASDEWGQPADETGFPSTQPQSQDPT